MTTGKSTFRVIVDEPATRASWGDLFERWKTGGLREEWAAANTDLFDSDDLRIKQPSNYFAEWYAAILLKQKFGLLSLVSKYGHHGCKTHVRKQKVLRQCLSPEQNQYVITPPKTLFNGNTGWPDLFVYAPDFSTLLFCEVKGPNDRLNDRQVTVFRSLQEATGIEVVLFTFTWLIGRCMAKLDR